MTPQDMQLAYELKCDSEAAVARLKELQDAAASGDAEAPRAQRLTAKMFATVRDLIAVEMDVKTRGTGGKYKAWVRRVGADKAALIAMRECISQCSDSGAKTRRAVASAQMLCVRIGRLYETEVRIAEAEEVNPMYMEKIHDQVRRNGTVDYGHLRRLYNVAYDRVMKGELDSSLSDSECIQVGKFGLDACYLAGLVKPVTMPGGMVIYQLEVEIADYLNDYDQSDVHGIVDRGAGAMQCPPLPWERLDGGGYLSVRRQQAFPLMSLRRVRRSEKRRIREQFTAEKMPQVFACANYLQSIPYTVHQPTLEAIRRAWQGGGNTMGLPSREKPAKPPFPLPEDWIKEDGTEAEKALFMAWKRTMTQYYTDMKKWRGHTQEIAGFLKLGLRDTSRLWFSVMMDTRGRWYYNGTPNPQGTDVAKGALHFADKKPLGRYGVDALKVQIANSYGFDKARTAARVRWVDEHWAEIERALDEPENHPDVWGDSPWCMFAAAWELREAYRSGNPATYETGVPCHQDATCSGLQHFSAMLRDPIGGKYVNLFDSGGDAKQDIYTKVANEAVEALRQRAEGVARDHWLRAGITRSQAKKPVMTYVYGATLRGTAEFLEQEALHDREDVKLEGQRNCDVATYGAKMLFSGIEATVPAAAQAMRWLKEACRTVPKGQRMEWTTPTGFKVQHDYQDVEQVRVRINSCGVNRVMIYEPLDSTNPSKMQNAIAPNFVHALDASHLTMTANRMNKEGLQMVAIHDSFGTHPCDVAQMNSILREEFVNLYTHNDVLLDFLWEVGGTGEAPKKSSLNLQEIKNSEFFFC